MYHLAQEKYNDGDELEEVLALLDSATNKDRKFVEPQLMKVKIYEEMSNFKMMKRTAKRYASKNLQLFPEFMYYLGYSEQRLGNYNEAYEALDLADKQKKLSKELKTKSFSLKNSCKFALANYLDPIIRKEKKLNNKINSKQEDSRPYLDLYGQYLYFTRKSTEEEGGSFDLYQAVKQASGRWSEAKKLSEVSTEDYEEFGASVTPDGKFLFFTTNEDDNLDIYVSQITPTGVSEPKSVGGEVNSDFDEKYPVAFYQNKMLCLIFSSNRQQGSEGGDDLWFSTMNSDGDWSAPKNLGSRINSPGNETQPFIDPSGELLMFSSNGREGYGGYDVYFSFINNKEWSVPKNLGYPINDYTDNYGVWLNDNKSEIYYTANKRYRGMDLYYSPIDDDIFSQYRGEHKTIIKFTLMMGEKPASNARINVYDYKSKKLLFNTSCDNKGLFSRKFKQRHAYRFEFIKGALKAHKYLYINELSELNDIKLDLNLLKDQKPKLVTYMNVTDEMPFKTYMAKHKPKSSKKKGASFKKFVIKFKNSSSENKINLAKIISFAQKLKAKRIKVVGYPDQDLNFGLARSRAIATYKKLKSINKDDALEITYKYVTTKKIKKFSRAEIYVYNSK
jgi:hypothetical protein